MTNALFQLEEFSLAADTQAGYPDKRPPRSAQSQSEIEEQKSAAYETGYAAGWDDSASSQTDLQTHVSAELAKNLQDFEFTFHEVRVQVMKSLEPLFHELVSKFLPAIAASATAPIAIEKLLSMSEVAVSSPLELVVSPNNRASVDTILSSIQAPPTAVSEDPALGGGQVVLRAGSTETHIDLDATIADIQNSIQAFYGSVTQEKHYG